MKLVYAWYIIEVNNKIKGIIKMNIFRKMIFIFGLLLALISIGTITSYEKNQKDKVIGKDY